MSLDIISREVWGGLPPKREMPLKHPVTNVFVMNVNVTGCYDIKSCCDKILSSQFFQVDNQAQDDSRFNFVAGEDGRIYEVRGWDVQPALPKFHEAHNWSSIFIAYYALFTAETMPDQMTTAVQRLVELGVKEKLISEWFLYRDITRPRGRTIFSPTYTRRDQRRDFSDPQDQEDAAYWGRNQYAGPRSTLDHIVEVK